MSHRIVSMRLSIRLLHVIVLLIVALAAFGAGLLARPWGGSAAPGGSLEACVNRYTGAVRMSPYGAPTCSAGETKMSWSSQDTDTDTHGVGAMVTRSTSFDIPAMSAAAGTVLCPAGYVPTGGGFANTGGPDVVYRTSAPSNEDDGWTVEAYNPSNAIESVGVWVRCALP